MVLAAEAGLWSRAKILGDLPSLCSGKPFKRSDRPIFFRSVGLGIEDVAVAWCLYKKRRVEHAIHKALDVPAKFLLKAYLKRLSMDAKGDDEDEDEEDD